MTAKQASKPAKRVRRFFLALLAIVVVLCLLLIGLFWGPAQVRDRGAEKIIEAVLGLRSEVTGLAVYPAIAVKQARIFEPRYPHSKAPLVGVSDLSLDYEAFPPDTRHVRRIHIDTLSLALHGADMQHNNLRYLLRGESEESESSPSLRLIPEKLAIDRIEMQLSQCGIDGVVEQSLDLQGLRLATEIVSLEEMRLALTGKASDTFLRLSPKGNAPIELPLELSNDLRYTQGKLSGSLAIEAGEYFQLNGSLAFLSDAQNLSFSLPQLECRARREILPWLNPFISPFHIEAEEMRFSAQDLAVHWPAGGAPRMAGEVALALPELRLQYQDALWYALPLDIQATVEGESLSGAMDMGAPSPLRWHLTYSAEAWQAGVLWEDWPKESLRACIPAPWQDYLDDLAHYEHSAFTAEAAYSPQGYHGKAFFTPQLPGSLSASVQLAAQGGYPLDHTQPCTGEVLAKLGEESLRLDVEFSSPEDCGLKALFHECDPSHWRQAWLSKPLVLPQCALNGELEFLLRPQQGMQVQLDLTASSIDYPDFSLQSRDTLSLKGAAVVDAAWSALSAEKLVAQLGDVVQLSLQDSRVNLQDQSMQSDFQLRAELDALGALFSINDFWGEAIASGRVKRHSSGAMNATIEVHAEDLGYQAWALPYGLPLDCSMAMAYQSQDGSVHLTDLDANLGEATRFRCALLALDASQSLQVSQAICTSDLQPLVKKQWLQEAQGVLKVDLPTLAWRDGEGPRFQAHCALNAALIQLPENSARFEAVAFEGSYRWEAGLSGEAPLSMAQALVGGATIEAIEATVAGEGRSLQLRELRAHCFDGVLRGEALVHFLEASFPFEMDLQLEDIDLKRFCQEMEPPSLMLTGVLHGAISVAADTEGLRALEVDLSSEEAFSLNREAVEQILMAQYVGGVSGGKRLDKVVRKVIGEEAQRPFDQAKIQLALENGRIVGQALLSSKKLNLTVDIKADPKALLEALRARQRDRLQGMDNP